MSLNKESGMSPVETRESREGTPPVQKNKKKGCMRHCKRFWWIYLIVAILVIVLAVCLM